MRTVFDIRGFVSSLRVYGVSAVEDVVIRHIFTKILNLLYNRNLPRWLNLVKDLMCNKNVLLIILDACRYDFFYPLVSSYFTGEVKAVKSEGTFLPWWIPAFLEMLPRENTRIFRATSRIKPHDLSLEGFLHSHTNTVELIELRPEESATDLVVHPKDVSAKVLEVGLAPRTIVWYMQPHFPWIPYPQISQKLMRLFMVYEFMPATKIRKYKGMINKNQVIKCYTGNLLLVLREVYRLIKKLDEEYNIFSRFKVVITADHGELLGEYGLFFHPPDYDLPQLKIIPWMEVHGVV